MADLNNIVSNSEKVSGRIRLQISMTNFRDFIEEVGLEDLNFIIEPIVTN